MSEDKRICDNCMKFNVSQCQTYESCQALHEGSKFIKTITADYTNERINGNKSHCKAFKKI